MTPEQLDADRAICEAATEGPWYATNGDGEVGTIIASYDVVYGPSIGSFDGSDSVNTAGERTVTPEEDIANAIFASRARTRWPAALDEIERLQKAIQEAPCSPERELSSYAFNVYGSDARLYNGIHDLETRLAEAEERRTVKVSFTDGSLSSFCPFPCGVPLYPKWKHCPNCGKPLEWI